MKSKKKTSRPVAERYLSPEQTLFEKRYSVWTAIMGSRGYGANDPKPEPSAAAIQAVEITKILEG